MTQFSSKLYESNQITLVVNKSKTTKKVIVVSSMHKSIELENLTNVYWKLLDFIKILKLV